MLSYLQKMIEIFLKNRIFAKCASITVTHPIKKRTIRVRNNLRKDVNLIGICLSDEMALCIPDEARERESAGRELGRVSGKPAQGKPYDFPAPVLVCGISQAVNRQKTPPARKSRGRNVRLPYTVSL